MLNRWLIFDTETTGFVLPSEAALKDQPRIIELALIEVIHENTGDPATTQTWVQNEVSWLINPQQMLPPEITKITGLTDTDLKDQRPFELVLPEIAECFLGARGLVAHNLPFDLAMLVSELRRVRKENAFPYPPEQICTVAAFEFEAGRRLKLPELYQRVCKKELKQTHRALDDTRALAEIVIAGGLIV